MGLRIVRRGVKQKFLIGMALLALALQPTVAIYSPVVNAIPLSTPAVGSVVINEIMANPASGSEWVELYNTTDAVIDISDWQIKDNGNFHNVPDGTLLAAYGFYVGEKNAGNGLANTGESVSIEAIPGSITLDTVTYPTVELGKSYARTTDGAATFELRTGADVTQNMTNALAPVSMPDTTDPTVTYVTPSVDGQRLNPTNTIKVDFADDSALKQTTVHGYLNGVAVPSIWQHPLIDTMTHSIELPLTGLSEGTYQIRAAATDQAGNTSQINRTFILDSTLPTISIKAGTNIADGSNKANDAYNRISFKLHDAQGKLKEVLLNGHSYSRGGVWNDLNWQNIVKSHLVQGTNSIYVVDAAGNTSSTLTFVYDGTGPTITIKDESVGTQSLNTYSNVSFKLYDAHQVDKVAINGVVKDLTNNKWSDINAVKPGVFGAVEGQNTLVAYDALGNTTTYEFTLDVVEPGDFTLVTPENGTTMNSSEFTKLDWTDAADASDVTYEVLLYKDGEWIPSSGKITTSEWTPSAPLAEGEYGWKVSATDAAGNVAWNTDGGRTFVIDNPEVPVIGEEPGDGDGTIIDDGETVVETDDTTTVLGANTLPPVLSVTPVALAPQVAVLGTSDDNTDDESQQSAAGIDDDKSDSVPLKDTAAVLGANDQSIFGLAWYWWLVVVAALVAGWLLLAAAIRRRKAENEA